MAEADEIRAELGTDLLSGLWERAREALEAANPPPTFRLELPDEQTQEAVGDLYGRPMWGQGTRISVSKLDARLREETRFGIGLTEVLEILHGRPVGSPEPATAEQQPRERGTASDAVHEFRQRAASVLRSALAEQGLDDAPWAEEWMRWLPQFGRIAEDELDVLASRAAGVLAALMLDPAGSPEVWASRADLAIRFGGGAHQLDNGTALSRIVLQAAAFAHGVDMPGNERDRRSLWERCGVTLDAVSATVLCWALPMSRTDSWSRALDHRTSIGLPAHLTQLDLRAAPEHPVDSGTVVAVCETPRVLEAVVHEGIEHPLICLQGPPTTVAVELLRRLTSGGAALRFHGDFDWPGVSMAGSLWSHHGATPWRMGAADYRESLDRAAADRTDLPSLIGERLDTPWDPTLAELMANTGRAIEEEMVLPTLLDDLRRGLD
ncbi:TIGR02679 family protein [Parasphingorhabdus pacifica]